MSPRPRECQYHPKDRPNPSAILTKMALTWNPSPFEGLFSPFDKSTDKVLSSLDSPLSHNEIILSL